MEKEKHDMIGSSSLIFIIPSLYTLLYVKNKYWLYKIFMVILPFISYMCNTTYNYMYHFCDLLNINCIGISYLFLQKHYTVAIILILLMIIEYIVKKINAMKNKKDANRVLITISTMLSFVTFAYYGFKHFTKEQTIVGIMCFIIALISFMKRNNYHWSYRPITVMWHTCNSILLLFVGKNLYIKN